MISVSELREEIKDGGRPQLIDVRTASEFAGGHIPCAINIPMDQFESRRPDLRLEGGVVLICKGGMRAQIVADWIGTHFAVRVLKGGTDAWRRDGNELVKSPGLCERRARLAAGLLIVAAMLLAISGIPGWPWLCAGLTIAVACDYCILSVLARMRRNKDQEPVAP